MTEKFVNFQMNFQTKEGKFYIADSPTGQSTIFMLPLKERPKGLFGSGIIFEPGKETGEIKAK